MGTSGIAFTSRAFIISAKVWGVRPHEVSKSASRLALVLLVPFIDGISAVGAFAISASEMGASSSSAEEGPIFSLGSSCFPTKLANFTRESSSLAIEPIVPSVKIS